MKKRCYWCHKIIGTDATKDHIPSNAYVMRGILPRKKVKKVNCCYNCNQERGQYTQNFIVIHDLLVPEHPGYKNCKDKIIVERNFIRKMGAGFIDWFDWYATEVKGYVRGLTGPVEETGDMGQSSDRPQEA